MSTPDEEAQRDGRGEFTGKREEPVNIASSQTSSSHSPQLWPTPSFRPAGSSLPELLATLSHEFRTPLTVIDGYTSMLLSQRPHLEAFEQDEFLQMIRQAGRRLEKLMAQLFEIVQLEAGIIELSLSPVDLPLLMREVIKEAERQVPEPLYGRFTFELQCRDAQGNQIQELPPVKGDQQRLRQILLHLLENAIRYSPTGGRIDVIARPAQEGGNKSRQGSPHDSLPCAELCVCDFGMGIADTHLERIFEPFYRVDSGLTRQSNGLGLGLTVCKHLVNLHQGQIWAESCPNGGSVFHVWLPFTEPVKALSSEW